MKAIVFLADGFEECEGLIAVDILRRAGVETIMASAMEGLQIDSSRHIKVMADAMAADIDYDTVDLIVLPGGRLGTENLGANDLVVEKCKEFAAQKHLAAICAAPSLLAALGLLDGKRATCYPGFEQALKDAGAQYTADLVTVDGNITTAEGPAAAFPYAYELLAQLTNKQTADQIAEGMRYKHLMA